MSRSSSDGAARKIVGATLVALAAVWLACSSQSPAPPSQPDAGVGVPDAGQAADASTVDGSTPGNDAGADSGTDAGGASACSHEPALTRVADTSPEVNLQGDPDGSVFGVTDPSIVYPDGGTFGVMAYSSVQLPMDAVVTRMAASNDHGDSWTFASQVNGVTPISITTSDPSICDAGTCDGMLVHEVPTVLLDPYEPDAGARIKVYTHSYFDQGNGKHRYPYGYIGLQTAGSVTGPWSAEEKVLGWTSSSPISSDGVNTNLTDIPALSDCVGGFSEPGVLLRADGAIDLSIGCGYFQNGWRIRIVLLRSFDRGHTFQYVSTMLTGDDAQCLGDTQPMFSASDLFVAHGQEYLMASTEGPIANPSTGSGHQACWVFPITDPDAGTVSRDDAGGPLAAQVLQSDTGRRTGACTYAEGAGGYLVPMGFYEDPPRIERILRPSVAGP